MSVLHELVLLSHTNNCSKKNKIVWVGKPSRTESQRVQKVLGSIPCICPGKTHCNLKGYLISHNFYIAWAIHFYSF